METFNSYLLEAVDQIHKSWAKKGYASAAYTHDFKVGHIEFNASNPPYTMCVAAQMEIILAALNIYKDRTGDNSFLNFLPDRQWTRQSPGTFKNLVWVNSGSLGTAFALERYGMGHQCPFDALEPGCFINLNRNNNTGHAVLFLGYLDEKGDALEKFGPKVAGFKYYSSQGTRSDGGFDFRYAFFEGVKPALDGNRRRDIGLIRSDKQKYLNCGYMHHPNRWVTPLGISDVDLESPEEDVNPAYLNQTTLDDQSG
jgi:hypothetical protein